MPRFLRAGVFFFFYADIFNEAGVNVFAVRFSSARITEHNPESQLPLIEFLGIHSLGDMVRLIEEEHDLTLNLAETMLRDSEIDEISSNAAYHFLFRAKLISGNYSKERIREFFMLTTKNEKSIDSNTEKIIAAQGELFGKTAP